jgi:putative selenium metabolism hydrolase
MSRDVTFNHAISFARDLVRIPSLSGQEGEVAERVTRELKQLAFNDVWIDRIGNVLACVRGRGEAPPIMLSSHLDIVDSGDPAEWEYPPFGGEIAENYLHGRGAVDCKGPLALQSYVAAGFLDSRPPGDIYLVHTVLEERGSWGMAYAVEHLALPFAAVILGEATAGDICIGHRGRTELEITIRGKSAHASAPDRACNPVDVVPALLLALRRFIETNPGDPLLTRPTLVPSRIETFPQSRNMVPEEVRIVLDWRTLPHGQRNDTDALRLFLLNQLCGQVGDGSELPAVTIQEVWATQRAFTGLEQSKPISTSGYLLSERHPLVRTAAQAVQNVTGDLPLVRSWTFGTDGAFSCGIYGIPTIGYAPGQEQCAHTNRERLCLKDALKTYQVYPVMLREIQQSLVAGSWEASCALSTMPIS